MTNNEHNEALLAEIMQLHEKIKELQGKLLLCDPLQSVDLAVCNANALTARQERFSEREQVKAVVQEVMVKVQPKKRGQKNAEKAQEVKPD